LCVGQAGGIERHTGCGIELRGTGEYCESQRMALLSC